MRTERASRRSRLLTWLLVGAGVVVLMIGIVVRAQDLHFQTVISNSMRPTVAAGDVAITQGVPMTSIRVGDVLVFYPPSQTEPVIHRVTSMHDGVITTRGDANTVDDPWQVTLAGTTAYRMVAVLPLLGWLAELQRPALLLAGVFVGLAILNELWKEVRAGKVRSHPDVQA